MEIIGFFGHFDSSKFFEIFEIIIGVEINWEKNFENVIREFSYCMVLKMNSNILNFFFFYK